MTDLRLIPDLEAPVGRWLREHAAIVALDARVAGSTPRGTTRPWIRVTQINATDRSGIEHLINYVLQLDCCAGKTATDAHVAQAEASLLRRTARGVLHSMQGTTADGLVIGSVRFTGDQHAPDVTLEPARERYILTLEVVAHATV